VSGNCALGIATGYQVGLAKVFAQLSRIPDRNGLSPLAIVASYVCGVIPVVNAGLEDQNPLASNQGTLDPPDQLLGLARKHGADHDFNPTLVMRKMG